MATYTLNVPSTAANTANETAVAAPRASARPARAAPMATGARKKLSVSISPTASTQAAMIQMTQPGMLRGYLAGY